MSLFPLHNDMLRWMSSIIGLITTWSAIRLVYWLDHTPTWAGVLMFIIPLLLLPLLASSYAEVNYEGAKIIQVKKWIFNKSPIENLVILRR